MHILYAGDLVAVTFLIALFSVQELSAIRACKLSVSRIRIYRMGESAFSATDILCSCILIGAYSFQSLHPKSFSLRLSAGAYLIGFYWAMPIYRTHGFILPAIPGTGEFPLYPIWFPALGIKATIGYILLFIWSVQTIV